MNEFSYKLKVFYEDTDSGGVVYYANYLKFFERARTEAIAQIGLSNKKLLEENHEVKSLLNFREINDLFDLKYFFDNHLLYHP